MMLTIRWALPRGRRGRPCHCRPSRASVVCLPLAKKASVPAPTSARPENIDGERIERLIDAVEAVADQIEVLRNVIDEIRDEFQWAVRNHRLAPHVVHVTSMAKDPCDPRWAEKLNRLTPADLQGDDLSEAPEEAEDEEAPRPTAAPKSGQQKSLWE